MKYDMQSLDYAIDAILPEIKLAKENGIYFNRPSLIGMIAKKYFIEHELPTHFKSSMCYYVVREAAKDLEYKGYFEFGNRRIQDEI